MPDGAVQVESQEPGSLLSQGGEQIAAMGTEADQVKTATTMLTVVDSVATPLGPQSATTKFEPQPEADRVLIEVSSGDVESWPQLRVDTDTPECVVTGIPASRAFGKQGQTR